MGKERYSEGGMMAAFGFLANALDNKKGSDGDVGAMFPRSDAEDMSKGARLIPGEVTLARRAGKKVEFVTECGPNCWYWKMPDGSRIYHWERSTYEAIGEANKRKLGKDRIFKDGAGPCPHCGNPNTNGGTVKA
jgi:hypothetical protein